MTHWTETLFREQADLYVPFFEERFDADPETALDVACGAGRHVIAFVDRGLDAEGLDFSERFLDEARERELFDNAAFRHHDMRELDEVTGSYDLVTSFWNSLGYYDRATDERVLEFVAGAETAVIYMTVEDLLTDDVRVAMGDGETNSLVVLKAIFAWRLDSNTRSNCPKDKNSVIPAIHI